jgi:hypothetical protein
VALPPVRHCGVFEYSPRPPGCEWIDIVPSGTAYNKVEATVDVQPFNCGVHSAVTASVAPGQGEWTKEYIYTDGSLIPYESKPFTIIVSMYWNVHGNSNNFSHTAAKSAAAAQGYCARNSEPDDEADGISTGHWAGMKQEGEDFQSVGLSLTWPPALDLVWDAQTDTWGDDAVMPKQYVFIGNVSNETEGGTRLPYIRVSVLPCAEAWVQCDTDCINAHAHCAVNVKTFEF